MKKEEKEAYLVENAIQHVAFCIFCLNMPFGTHKSFKTRILLNLIYIWRPVVAPTIITQNTRIIRMKKEKSS